MRALHNRRTSSTLCRLVKTPVEERSAHDMMTALSRASQSRNLPDEGSACEALRSTVSEKRPLVVQQSPCTP